MTASPGSLAFGDVQVGTTSPAQTITVTNTGDATSGLVDFDFSESQALVSAFGISATTCTGTLAAGASCTIDVTFTPPSVGAITATASATVEPGGTLSVTLSGSGVGVPDVPPTAVADSTSVGEDSGARTLDVLGNDDNADGGPIEITSVTSPASGTVTIANGGQAVIFTPAPDFSGEVTFSYTLNGGSTAQVTVEVRPVDDPPAAVNDTYTFEEDVGASPLDVLVNDTDPDGGAKNIIQTSQPAHGSVASAAGGLSLIYTPAANFTGTDSFTYTLSGGSVGTVSLTVTPVDDLPVGVDDRVDTAQDVPVTFDARANDTDPDGGPKTVTAVTQPPNGSVVISGDGSLVYTPNAGYSGNDSFTYTLNGGSTATVLVLVTSAFDTPPISVDDQTTVAEDAPATPINVLANDQNPDGGPLAIISVMQPPNGTVAITGGGTGVTFQPAPNFNGTTSFLYTLNGGSTAAVTITVTSVDDPRVAAADAATVVEDSPPTTISVLVNDLDVDGGPAGSVTAVTQPANGTAAVAPGGQAVTYAPRLNFAGVDTFTYTITGGSTATVTVTVTPVDDLPVAVDDVASIPEDAPPTAVDVLANDTDVDAGPKTIVTVTQGTSGVVAITGGGTGLTYSPNPDFNGTDSFSYTLNGGATATVAVTVTPVDDAPVAEDDFFTVEPSSDFTRLAVTDNDTDFDGGGQIRVIAVSQPLNGDTIVSADGLAVEFRPDIEFEGTTSFVYTVEGGDTALVVVDVASSCVVYDAFDDCASVYQLDDSGTVIDVLGNDTWFGKCYPDVSIASLPSHGQVEIVDDGYEQIRYIPDGDFCSGFGLGVARAATVGDVPFCGDFVTGSLGPGGPVYDSFTYRAGGAFATVYVFVTCAPVFD